MKHSVPLCLFLWISIHLMGSAQTISKQFEQTKYDIKDLHMLVNEIRPAGTHNIRWDGRDDAGRQVSPGVYICKMISGAEMKSKMIILTGTE